MRPVDETEEITLSPTTCMGHEETPSRSGRINDNGSLVEE